MLYAVLIVRYLHIIYVHRIHYGLRVRGAINYVFQYFIVSTVRPIERRHSSRFPYRRNCWKCTTPVKILTLRVRDTVETINNVCVYGMLLLGIELNGKFQKRHDLNMYTSSSAWVGFRYIGKTQVGLIMSISVV